MDANLTATVAYLQSLYTPADLRKLADAIAPAGSDGTTTTWDAHNILSGQPYVLGAYSGRACTVCATVIPAHLASHHAGWHNDQARRAS